MKYLKGDKATTIQALRIQSEASALNSYDFAPIWLTLRLASHHTAFASHRHAARLVAGTYLVLVENTLGAIVATAPGAATDGAGLLPADRPGTSRPARAVHPVPGLGSLPFTFAGLVVGSVLYSLPFVVQPIQNAFEALGSRPLEVASTLRAGPWDRFFSVAIPLARPGFLTATILGFAHTVGEFGVVLMIGGNIPGATRVLSVAIYDHVEAMEYAQAHWLAGGMLLFSFRYCWRCMASASVHRELGHERPVCPVQPDPR